MTMAALRQAFHLSSFFVHMNTGDALQIYSGDALWEKDIKPIELKAGENDEGVDLTFPINGLHVISGTVVAKADGHAVNAGTVELEDAADKTQKLRTAMVGKDGTFQFNYVPDGSYRLEVTGAADMAGTATTDSNNPLVMLLNKDAQSVKDYGTTGITLTLPGNSEELALQVPDAGK
jgi:hypothetical protein